MLGASREWPWCEEDALLLWVAAEKAVRTQRGARVAVRVGAGNASAGPLRPVGAPAAEEGACAPVRRTKGVYLWEAELGCSCKTRRDAWLPSCDGDVRCVSFI